MILVSFGTTLRRMFEKHVHTVSLLASVSLGKKSVCILCCDELDGLWRQTFDVSDVPARQNNVTGLVPHL